MGQRVIIVVEVKLHDKLKRVAYHHQWGYGAMGACACLGMLGSGVLEARYNETPEDVEKRLQAPADPHLSVYFTDEQLKDFETPDGELDMKEVIEHHDNNNGAIYFQTVLDDYGNLARGKIRFFRGDEDVRHEEIQFVGQEMDLRHYFRLFEDEYHASVFEDIFKYFGVETKWD